MLLKDKQVAQRATIAHLSPMCQGQISFQKHINGPWKPEARNQTHPSFYLHIKFDQDKLTGFRGIQVQKCEIFVTQGQVTPK